ncbi:MAG: carboxymuconolactone decarboxylase family protein [Acidimicrobiia bacterium]|nr:carboxymuconolactone decarboxylase family protein [Acidimicrobiia bacterium]
MSRSDVIQPRLEYKQIAPEGYEALSRLEVYTRRCGLEPSLLDVVEVRASQINGCAYCLDLHTWVLNTRMGGRACNRRNEPRPRWS